MFSESKVTEIYCMADDFCKEFVLQQEKYMIEDKKISIATSLTVWAMPKLWWFLSCFIPVAFAASNIITKSMSANTWKVCSQDVYPIAASWNWKRKSCFLWPFFLKKSCWEPVPASVLSTLLLCVSVVTSGYWFTKLSKDLPNVGNVPWDGSSDSSCIWLSMTKAKSLILCLPREM